jgi:hypothetical protein
MFKFLNLTKISAGLTVGGVIVAYYKLDKIKNTGVVHASWTDEFIVPNIQWPKWDSNWDRLVDILSNVEELLFFFFF